MPKSSWFEGVHATQAPCVQPHAAYQDHAVLADDANHRPARTQHASVSLQAGGQGGARSLRCAASGRSGGPRPLLSTAFCA